MKKFLLSTLAAIALAGAANAGSTTLLDKGMDGFTINDVSLGEGLTYVWKWDDKYGAKATAYLDGNIASDSYLISPELTLDATATSATFSQALNYLNGNTRSDFVNVCVREGNSGDWTVANVSNWPAGSDWNFVDDCVIDLSAYAGKTIQIAFHYQSTSSCATTWEVKRLSFDGTAAGGSTGGDNGDDTPSTPGNVNPGDFEGLVQNFAFDLGFPEKATVPTSAQTYKASDTNITYEIMGCYITSFSGSSYLMVNGKDHEGAYISWTLDSECAALLLTTTSNCSENAASKVNVYANGNMISEAAVNVHNVTVMVEIPEAYRAAGTVYKVESATNKYNQQFASFKYVNSLAGVEEIIAADDSEAVYFNLQGQKVNNPERGIYIKVVNGKAAKILK